MAGWPWLTFGGTSDPPTFRREVRARPQELGPLRGALRAWLVAAGVGEDDVVAIQIAAGEAAANAVEHAYAGIEPGPVWLAATLEPPEMIRVEIGDCGRWRPQRDPDNDHRGRGLLLMRKCVDEVSLAQSPAGTTVILRLRLSGKHD